MSKKKPEPETHAKNWERTGERTLNIKHDDGSVFECVVDDPKRFDGLKGGKGKVMGGFHGIGEKQPLICDSCKQQVGKITITITSTGKTSLCGKCS